MDRSVSEWVTSGWMSGQTERMGGQWMGKWMGGWFLDRQKG